jgi:hypothetical protein
MNRTFAQPHAGSLTDLDGARAQGSASRRDFPEHARPDQGMRGMMIGVGLGLAGWALILLPFWL